MTESTIAVPETPKSHVTAEPATRPERTITPPVDIVETAHGLVLMADLPGVEHDQLEIGINHGVLTIRGQASLVTPGKHEQLSGRSIFRQFKLSDTIDPDRIEAKLKYGVLRLDLPKVEAAKAKKIDVKTG